MKERTRKITPLGASEIPTVKLSGQSCLVLLYPPGPEMGKRFPLDKSEIVLGRSRADIQIDLDSVSRRHARVFSVERQWSVEDLGSTNGTYINDLPVKRSRLTNGDILRVGSSIFKFLSGPGVEASYHEEIYRMTIIDTLTGANNRRFLTDFVEREIARSVRHGRPLSLLLFDIDHFKRINDTHGHLTGDEVLKGVSRRLSARVRTEELLARYGGEEFVVVVPETDQRAALILAEEYRALVADEPFRCEGHVVEVTISIGVATLEGEEIDTDAFLKRADDKLYEAKRAGRNRVAG
jgi:diguanylate cyclase (GGDEF)-like protein